VDDVTKCDGLTVTEQDDPTIAMILQLKAAVTRLTRRELAPTLRSLLGSSAAIHPARCGRASTI
jgi:hypothetical protein